MNAEAEEWERLDAELAAADWCVECDRPIGHGWCDGCLAVAGACYLNEEELSGRTRRHNDRSTKESNG